MGVCWQDTIFMKTGPWERSDCHTRWYYFFQTRKKKKKIIQLFAFCFAVFWNIKSNTMMPVFVKTHFRRWKQHPDFIVHFVLEIKWRFRIIDAEPSSDFRHKLFYHYSGVIMSTMASQINRRLRCLLNRLLGTRSKKTSKLRVTGLCEGNSPLTGEFPSQRASNAENVSI